MQKHFGNLTLTFLMLPALMLTSALLHAPSALGQVVVGHRGASADAPENTLAAFNEAWNQGADGIEGDFYFTRDQQIVCIHDSDTKRTGGKSLKVASSTLAELRKLEYGGWKSKKFAGEPIPTFQQVLECVPEGKLFVIELKTGPEIVPLLAAQLASEDIDRSQLLIISFNHGTIAKSKELLPDIRAHWLTSYKQNRLTGKWSPSVSEVAEQLRTCGADGLGTKGDRRIVTPAFIAKLRGSGMKEFHVWTIDDPADASYFQELGAVGITTNRPAIISEALAESAATPVTAP